MSKISDNASEGSYNPQQQLLDGKKPKQHIDKFRHTKQGPLGPNSSVGGISDLKIDGGKTQTFHSDVEEYSNLGGGQPGLQGQQALPPIVMPVKKAGKKKGSNTSNLATFNATKK